MCAYRAVVTVQCGEGLAQLFGGCSSLASLSGLPVTPYAGFTKRHSGLQATVLGSLFSFGSSDSLNGEDACIIC